MLTINMATITLNLSPELEYKLRNEAAKLGLEPDLYIVNTLQKRLEHKSPDLTSQPTEAELLQQINIGFSATTWNQYHTLIGKRRAETLNPEEHEQLIQLSNQLENLNVNRCQALIQLAKLRNKPLTDLMQTLGINPDPDVIDYP
ncbi:MAG: hypothetical protein DSM106950_40130 [Stigonema ocellatum SAG 48.90 = DSM 106950]|nr:hypothetical protein [Stigonema ocellatum SAG 48.90 = DSM 106950]